MSLEKKAPANGFVISDLHLFTHRSNTPEITDVIFNLAKSNSFCVLNGDIFDFKWSYFATTEDTIQKAIEWLTQLASSHPDCHFYYVLGNHDCLESFVEHLDKLPYKNLSWHSTHLRLGTALLLHGDLPLHNKDILNRKLPTKENPKGKLANLLYNAVISASLHKAASLMFTPSLCAGRILKAIDKYDNTLLNGVSDIYFGHTHAPFEDFKFREILFHNTGSAVKRMRQNILKVTKHD